LGVRVELGRVELTERSELTATRTRRSPNELTNCGRTTGTEVRDFTNYGNKLTRGKGLCEHPDGGEAINRDL
jgi:hypothetical protein